MATDNARGRAITTPARLLARAGCGLLLCGAIACAHAATIYKCVSPHGAVTFQDIPCATSAQQTRLDARGQPLIDPDAPRDTPAIRSTRPHPHATTRHVSHARHARLRRPPMSWQCTAADGEVFYRHTRCPGSVPGDGVVRSRYAQTRARSRRRHNAWSRVPVHGVKIPRAEACRRIHSAGAAGRDGHLRDAHVSTYDHLMGRDPCPDP